MNFEWLEHYSNIFERCEHYSNILERFEHYSNMSEWFEQYSNIFRAQRHVTLYRYMYIEITKVYTADAVLL